MELLEQIPVTRAGKQVPLVELADIRLEETPPNIEHEAASRRTFIQTNVRGRDVVSFA
jgi:cobalt-zinc-cadmium resistance protein CzcA